jgi:phage shock protein A
LKAIELKVNGELISVDADDLLTIENVGDDMDCVAAQMGYWATIHAAAERERVQADSYYRQWRAEAGRAMLHEDPKLAEWKVKQAIEADKTFQTLKNALAESARNVTIARGLYDALKTKASMLQSKGAMMRAEMDATDMSTKESVKKTPKKSTAELSEGIRGTFKTKKKKKKKTTKA